MFYVMTDCQFFFCYVHLGEITVENINWDKPVEDSLQEILQERSKSECYLLLDESSDMPDKVKCFYKLVQIGHSTGWKVIIASTSGARWLEGKNLLAKIHFFQTSFTRVEVLPFSSAEASYYLQSIEANEQFFHEIVNIAGRTPFALHYFQNVQDITNFDIANKFFHSFVLQVEEMQDAGVQKVQRSEFALSRCVIWLHRASIEYTLRSGDFKDYLQSYGAEESLTYLVKEAQWNDWKWPPNCTTEKPTEKTSEEAQGGIQTGGGITETKHCEGLKVFLTFPLSHGLLVSKLVKKFKLKEVRNPTVRGYLLEKEFFLYSNLSKLQWKVRAIRDSDDKDETDLTFSGIIPAFEQETFHVETINPNRLYFLKLKHEVIDALFVADDSNHTRYLVLLQISLSTYAKHKSKFGDIYKQKKFGEEKISMLDYYSSISGIDKERALYLHVSPNQVLNKQDDLWNIFDIKPAPTTRTNATQVKVTPKILVGALVEHCDVADFLQAISRT